MAPPVLPIFNGVYEWLSTDNDDDDVVSIKSWLQRLGYGRKAHPSCLASKEFFDDIRDFQKDNGLKVDGVVTPSGETVQTMGKLLSEQPPDELDPPKPGEKPSAEQCWDNLQNIDGEVCRHIEKFRGADGRRAAARCWATANARYAECLRGRPLDDLPPLDVYNN